LFGIIFGEVIFPAFEIEAVWESPEQVKIWEVVIERKQKSRDFASTACKIPAFARLKSIFQKW